MANIFTLYKESRKGFITEFSEKVNKVIEEVLKVTESIPEEIAKEMIRRRGDDFAIECSNTRACVVDYNYPCDKSYNCYLSTGVNLNDINEFLQLNYAEENLYVSIGFWFDLSEGTILMSFNTDDLDEEIKREVSERLFRDIKEAFPNCQCYNVNEENCMNEVQLFYKIN